MKRIIGTAIFIIGFLGASAQTSMQKLKVFIDCSRVGCDRTFIRSQIRIVDFLLDSEASDVHILITAQRAGSGGKQYELLFYGQHDYEYYQDTLYFNTSATATSSEVRKQMVKGIMTGIAPLVAKTGYGSAISINMEGGESSSTLAEEVTKDKWNYWTFNVGVDGRLNIDKNYKNNRFSSDFSADRTTEDLKVGFRVYGSKNHSVYQYEDSSGTSKYVVNNSDYGIFHNLVKSLATHWSYGYQVSLSNSTFSNYKNKFYFSPAIEYNFYPYSEVNSRFFVLRYGVDVSRNRYYDTTIYDKLKETLYGHKLSAALILNQKWGTFYSGVYYRNYFSDWRMNSMGINLNVSVRITGALSFYINTNGNIVHDQVYLVKGNVSEQDLLTKTRQLGSSYNYNLYFGVNFRFGSKLNNFVNPRFQGFQGF
ncbi:MAG TPA: hypothetical protein VFT78_11530 [Hanamia sp.]|jgi:hypothetical protein|nr:hypothetical protein [Hanamia sp.]